MTQRYKQNNTDRDVDPQHFNIPSRGCGYTERHIELNLVSVQIPPLLARRLVAQLETEALVDLADGNALEASELHGGAVRGTRCDLFRSNAHLRNQDLSSILSMHGINNGCRQVAAGR